MLTTFGIFSSLALAGSGFVAYAWHSAYRLAPDGTPASSLRWLLPWCIKGLGVPMALWLLMNAGLSEYLQPFMPQVQMAMNSGQPWIGPFLTVAAAGWFFASSYWCALTMGWLVFRFGEGLRGQSRSDFRSLCLMSFAGMLIPALLILSLAGSFGLGVAAIAMLAPIAGYAPGSVSPKPARPMYARAIARMKFGKYTEAEWEIIHQLERHEDDFDGWLMLAELYAARFNDLREAEQTILELCDQPRTNASQLSVALNKLADWHLNLANDPDAARRALQVISNRLPGTILDRAAQARAGRLPATAQELRKQRQPQTIALPPGAVIKEQEPQEPPPPKPPPIKIKIE